MTHAVPEESAPRKKDIKDFWFGGPHESGNRFIMDCKAYYSTLSEDEKAEFKASVEEFKTDQKAGSSRTLLTDLLNAL